MRFSRAIIAVIMALLFVVTTNGCALAAAFPNEIDECCRSEQVPGKPTVPCGGGSCAPCATLGSGLNVTSLIPLTVAMTIWTEDKVFADLMRRTVAALVNRPFIAPLIPEWIPSPPWHEAVKQALPVRGPSLFA